MELKINFENELKEEKKDEELNGAKKVFSRSRLIHRKTASN